VRDEFVQGMGENLVDLSPDSLRVMLGGYIDRGVDFVKIGVTTHTRPAFLLFSPSALAAMVETAHARGRKVDVHAGTVEGLRMATLAGVDVLQHPEVVSPRLPPDLVDSIRARGTICSMMPVFVTGAEWKRFQDHLALGGRMWPPEKPPTMTAADADSLRRIGIDPAKRPLTPSVEHFQNQRWNAEALTRSGCTISVATDDLVNVPGAKSAVRMGDKFYDAVEGLVELGMTASQALVAATRNGAMASGLLSETGTIAVGKRADLVVLGANPLTDIHNIRSVAMVVHRGRVLER
jgi:imidazolonepropionase-like amidohydrolase